MKVAFSLCWVLFFTCSATDFQRQNAQPARFGHPWKEAVLQDTTAPNGIYGGTFPGGIQHTIRFNTNETFDHQQHKRTDPQAITKNSGTWSNGMGNIFLSQQGQNSFHIVFKPVVDTLFGVLVNGVKPTDSTKYSLVKQKAARETSHWQKEFGKGLIFAGVGNEPFWNIRLSKSGAVLQFLGNDQPIILTGYEKQIAGDTVTYRFSNDNRIVLRVFSQFCSDGMSDLIYDYRVTLRYDKERYHGCGVAAGSLTELMNE